MLLIAIHTRGIKCALVNLYFLLRFSAWHSEEKQEGSMSFLVSAGSSDVPLLFGCFLLLTIYTWMLVQLLSQRWVSEKLSVESLQDLQLFGGEPQPPIIGWFWPARRFIGHQSDRVLVPISLCFFFLCFLTNFNWKWCWGIKYSLINGAFKNVNFPPGI